MTCAHELAVGMPVGPRRWLAVFFCLVVGSNSPGAGPAPLSWRETAPGVWQANAGDPEGLTLLGAADAQPNLAALGALPVAPFPLERSEIVADRWDWKTAVRLPLALGEEIYGLGVDFKTMRRTGATVLLHVDHWGGVPGRTHAPVPLYVSSHGYAVLFNTARYLKVSVGLGVRLAAAAKPPVLDRNTDKTWAAQPRSDSIEALVNAPGLEILVFAGPTPLDAIRRYNLYCGGGALPPKWGLGFLARTPTRYTAEQALNEIDAFRQNGIPLDMLGLEPGWQSNAYPCSFEWDPRRFPDPAAFLAEVERRHVRVNLWFNPYVAPATPLGEKLRPFAGTHLVWNGLVPDYSLAEARSILAGHLRRTVLDLNPRAVGGFKLDEVDGYDRYLWPDTARFPSGRDGEQLRQTYGLLTQRTVHELFRQQNRRTLGQVRGSNAGASRFPFVIYNDNYDFDEYITAVGNSGFAGVLWSPEVRGGKAVDMLRRTQAVCFSPLALFNGWATDDKLWTHPEVKAAIRDAILLRQRLLPYLYTTFAQYHFEGTPVIRPMPLIPGFKPAAGAAADRLDATANPYAISRVVEVKDQYLLGDALLVAPIAPGATSRKVTLPPGRWYDFYTGRLSGENETIEVSPALDRIPLFVRDGALLPLIAERQWSPQRDEILPLEIRHYGEKPGRLRLYDDDGESFDFEQGDYSWTEVGAARDPAGHWIPTVTPDPNGRAWRYRDVRWTFMTSP